MKKLFIGMLLVIFSLDAFAQRGQKIESLKVGYLTNKLNLDAKTAERFWPVYHQYENELMAVVRERRMNQNETRNAEEILDQEQKALDIKRKYNGIFSKVISGDQLNELYRAEKDFRQMVINRAQKREIRQERTNQPQPVLYNRPERRIDNRPSRLEQRPATQSEPYRSNRPAAQPASDNKKPRFGK